MGLTNKEIDNAKPKDKKYKLADGGGLCLHVSPSGAKLWVWRYRIGGTEKNMAFGEYPMVTIKEARELHFAARKALDTGVDPMAERRAESDARKNEAKARQREAENSFEDVARKWWEWWAIGKSPRHADTVMRRLQADVFPAYGHKFIDNVTAADIRKLMISVEARDARDVAKRVHETTSQIFRFAVVRDIAGRNPAADFKPRDILAEARTENRARVDAKELPELLAKMEDYNGDALTRLAMRLMAYTFVRTSEEIEAPWSEFDLDEARWTIPAERMKMNTPHIVPLSRQAVEVLRALKLLTGNGRFVLSFFPQTYNLRNNVFRLNGNYDKRAKPCNVMNVIESNYSEVISATIHFNRKLVSRNRYELSDGSADVVTHHRLLPTVSLFPQRTPRGQSLLFQ